MAKDKFGLIVLISFLAIFVPSCVSFSMWITAESDDDLQVRGGIKAELSETMWSQISEYAASGRASSRLYINSHCYKGKTKILKSSNSVANIVQGRQCDGFAFRDSVTPESRVERIFMRDSSSNGERKVIRVSCEGSYWGKYKIATSEKTMPQLLSEGLPSCPPDNSGNAVSPEYEEYLINRKGSISKIKP